MGVLRQPPSPSGPLLTSREEQVVEMAATGLVFHIATRLHISHITAKTPPAAGLLYEKLGAPNRSAAVAIASAGHPPREHRRTVVEPARRASRCPSRRP